MAGKKPKPQIYFDEHGTEWMAHSEADAADPNCPTKCAECGCEFKGGWYTSDESVDDVVVCDACAATMGFPARSTAKVASAGGR
jgi:hypothetical protein